MAEQPRIGVYVCHCGINIAHTVDVARVAEEMKKLPGVVVARDYKFMCSDPGQQLIIEDIKQHNLNRIVVAACSPHMHEPTFRKATANGGLNPYLFQMVNIREHCSWVHKDREVATHKAIALVTAGVRRVANHEPLTVRSIDINPSVLVIGGGIAGIEAALKAAEAGKKVYLVEREQSIGGKMAKFDKTFPTLDCSACILTPKMVQVAQHPNIELLTYSEIEEISGFVGNFTVKIRKKAKYVDYDKCTGCGTCIEKCPKRVPSEFEEGLTKRKAIYRMFPQAIPNKPVIDAENCLYLTTGKCRVCEKVCEPKAINWEDKDEIIEVKVGAIVAAVGFELIDPKTARLDRYGYGRLPDVYTSLEFERICNSSGPTEGKIVCKDGRVPERVAILHCIGSRDQQNGVPYCSRVCCMYSLKYAHLIKERTGAEVYEFYIDMRTPGKDYEEFYDRLREEGVHFIRGKVARVDDLWRTEEEKGKLIVHAENTLTGQYMRLPVDMVILSLGLKPPTGAEELSQKLGLCQTKDGFFMERHPKLAPVSTFSDGIYIAGCIQGPKDIPDTVAQANAAAAEAIQLIDKGEKELEPNTAYIEEEVCSGCKLCISMCPYSAISYDYAKGVSVINEALCKGCGTCVATCPSGAARQRLFKDEQIFDEIEGLLSVA